MAALSSAIAAMDKATPGEFERYLYQHDVAKPALAWIKEALPWLEERRADAQSSIDALYLEVDGWEQNPGYVAVMNMNKDIAARLDALIARAKPEEVGHAEH